MADRVPADPGRTPIAVSIVVPVYNIGVLIDPCVDSLLAQTMPPGQLELIFVDDGSTDDSLARLQRLEAEHGHVRVLSIPPSGWPGRPRNVGTDAAQGEYVMYVDQDDRLDPEAMERMYAIGAANGADVVLGKVISDFRGVHHYLYRENRPRCTVFDSKIMGSQTPHKMLRRQFLREHGIRYPEGRRRLEDQVFITRAYFAASVVSIRADYVCYRYLRRVQGRNAGSSRIEPASYYDNLREVLDVVDAHTSVGEQRDQFYRRYLKTEMLGRLSGRKLRTAPPEQRNLLFAEIRRLMSERFPETVDDGAAALVRIRADLARRGTVEDLVGLADRIHLLQPVVHLTGCQPLRGGTVQLGVDIEFHYGAAPLLLQRCGQDWLLPAQLAGPQADERRRRIEPLTDTAGDVVIQHRELLDEWFVPAQLSPVIEPVSDGARLHWQGQVILDPVRVAGGSPLRSGVHDLYGRVDAFGINRTVRLPAEQTDRVLLGRPGASSVLYANRGGHLSVRTQLSARTLRRELGAVAALRQSGEHLRVHLPDSWRGTPTRLELTAVDGQTPCTIALVRSGTGWRSADGALRAIPTARYTARLKVKGLAGSVELAEPVKVVRSSPRVRQTARRWAGRLWRRLRRGVRS